MKKIIVIWLPFFSGLILIVVAAIDLQQFRSDIIDAHTMLSREIPFVLIGMVSSLVVFFSTFYWLYKKQWLTALQSLVSPILFIVCFGVGGAMGAAYLNAT